MIYLIPQGGYLNINHLDSDTDVTHSGYHFSVLTFSVIIII